MVHITNLLYLVQFPRYFHNHRKAASRWTGVISTKGHLKVRDGSKLCHVKLETSCTRSLSVFKKKQLQKFWKLCEGSRKRDIFGVTEKTETCQKLNHPKNPNSKTFFSFFGFSIFRSRKQGHQIFRFKSSLEGIFRETEKNEKNVTGGEETLKINIHYVFSWLTDNKSRAQGSLFYKISKAKDTLQSGLRIGALPKFFVIKFLG